MGSAREDRALEHIECIRALREAADELTAAISQLEEDEQHLRAHYLGLVESTVACIRAHVGHVADNLEPGIDICMRAYRLLDGAERVLATAREAACPTPPDSEADRYIK